MRYLYLFNRLVRTMRFCNSWFDYVLAVSVDRTLDAVQGPTSTLARVNDTCVRRQNEQGCRRAVTEFFKCCLGGLRLLYMAYYTRELIPVA